MRSTFPILFLLLLVPGCQTSRTCGPHSPLEAKLDAIVIPSIDFEDAPFDDVMAFLKMSSVHYDRDPDPCQKGVFITSSPHAFSEVRRSKVTLTIHAKDISLREALDEVSRQSGVEFRVEECVLMVLRKND